MLFVAKLEIFNYHRSSMWGGAQPAGVYNAAAPAGRYNAAAPAGRHFRRLVLPIVFLFDVAYIIFYAFLFLVSYSPATKPAKT